MNPERTILSNEQLIDAAGTVDEQIDGSLGSERDTFFNTESQTIARPNYEVSLYKSFKDDGLMYRNSLEMDMNDQADRNELTQEHWHNMRAMVGRFTLDNTMVWYPGTIGPDGSVIYLESHRITDPAKQGPFHAIQHDALDKAYLLESSSAEHGDVTNAGESKHGLRLASSESPLSVHDSVHSADVGNFTNNTKTVHDIRTGNGELKVRPNVIGLGQAHTLIFKPEFQPEGPNAFGLEVSPQKLLIASTMAAALSRGSKVNVGDNISAMAERTTR